MPFKRVIDTQSEDSSGAGEAQADLATKLQAVLPKVDLLVVKRYPKNTGKAKSIGQPLDVKFDPTTEDAETLCREIADDAMKMAIEEAGDKRSKFCFVAYAEAQTSGARGEIFSLDHWLHPDDERPTTKDSEYVGMVRVAKEHMGDVCKQHASLMKEVNGLVGMVRDSLGKLTDSSTQRWQAEVDLAKMKYEHDVTGARLLVQQDTAKSRHRMWVDLIKTVTPFGERLVEAFAGKPREEDAPSPDEIDKIFGKDAPDLRDHALAVIRVPAGDKRNELAVKFRDAWVTAGDQVQKTAMKRAHEQLGEERAKRITMWLVALFNGLPG